MSDNKRPASYVVQPACANCKQVFVESDYDSGLTHYCTFGAPPRPRCGSVALNEAFSDAAPLAVHIDEATVEDFRKHEETVSRPAMDAWWRWAEHREVEPNGWCDEYEPAEETN